MDVCEGIAEDRLLSMLRQSNRFAGSFRGEHLGLVVMEALSARLLELDDFEELITYLKVGTLCMRGCEKCPWDAR